jgi:hypothetical protein
MRRCLQLTGENKVRNEKTWDRMEVTCSITKRLENRSLQWYGHAQHMQEDKWPKRIMQWSAIGKDHAALGKVH